MDLEQNPSRIPEELQGILINFFKTIEREGEPLNSFYKAGLTLIPNPSKDTSKNENYTLYP